MRDRTPRLPGAFVSLRWGEVLLGRGGAMQRTTPIVDTFANDEGWFTACVPGGVQMTVRATHETDLSGNVELGVPAHAILRRDIYVGRVARRKFEALIPRRPVARGRSASSSAAAGELRGIVRALDGAPIEGARVALLSGLGETRTNARGEFVLQGLPMGTHTIEARAIGYVPGQEIADIVEFRDEVAAIHAGGCVGVTCSTRCAWRPYGGLMRPRAQDSSGVARSGSGYFLDESVLDTMKA